MSRIRALSASMRCDSCRTSSASLAISAWLVSTAFSPSVETRAPAWASPITVSAVSAALVAVCDSCPMVAVVSRTLAAVSAAMLEKALTLERSDWAMVTSVLAACRKPSRRPASARSASSWAWPATQAMVPRKSGAVTMMRTSGFWTARSAPSSESPAGLVPASMMIPITGKKAPRITP